MNPFDWVFGEDNPVNPHRIEETPEEEEEKEEQEEQ